MTTTYMTLEDPLNPSGALNFVSDGNFQQTVHEVGQVWFPLGNPFPVKSTDGSKGLGGILVVTTASDADDAKMQVLAQTSTELTLTLPNGDSYTIMWDPATDRKGVVPYSYMANPDVPPLKSWTCTFYQAA